MFKVFSFFSFIVFIFIIKSYSQTNDGQADLAYSQIGLPSNYVSIISDPSSQIYDDFSITSDWYIYKVIVVGADVSSSNNSFDVYFYNNDNGVPGALIYSAINQIYTISMLTWDIYQVTITLEIPAKLNLGDYFLSVRTFWWNQIEGSYGGAALSSPDGTTWVPVGPNSLTEYTDMYFELYGNSVTPVELTSFSATANDDNVVLSWITATETNNSGFDIQRSKDGEFETIGFVEGNGTTTEPQVYSFIDEEVVTGKYKYRLKQIDFDGTFEYSNEVEIEITTPSIFSLEQNYPNPFNPSTKIKYSLPQSSNVEIKIYDVLGKESATLVSEYKPAGSYEIQFDASLLPSGTYFYQIHAGSFLETKKMILMK